MVKGGEECMCQLQLALRYHRSPFGILRFLIYEGTSIFYSTQARERNKELNTQKKAWQEVLFAVASSYLPRCKQPACSKQNSRKRPRSQVVNIGKKFQDTRLEQQLLLLGEYKPNK